MRARAPIDLAAVRAAREADEAAEMVPPAQLLHESLRRVFAEAIDELDLDAPSALAALRLFTLDVINSTARDAMFQQALAAFSTDTVEMARLLYDENGELRDEPDLDALQLLNRKYRH
jgi:hypothetical protein